MKSFSSSNMAVCDFLIWFSITLNALFKNIFFGSSSLTSFSFAFSKSPSPSTYPAISFSLIKSANLFIKVISLTTASEESYWSLVCCTKRKNPPLRKIETANGYCSKFSTKISGAMPPPPSTFRPAFVVNNESSTVALSVSNSLSIYSLFCRVRPLGI